MAHTLIEYKIADDDGTGLAPNLSTISFYKALRTMPLTEKALIGKWIRAEVTPKAKTGTITGATVPSNWLRVVAGLGYKGNGTNSYLNFPHAAAMDFNYNAPFSVEILIKFTASDLAKNVWILGKHDVAARKGWYLYKTTGNRLRWVLEGSSSKILNIESTDADAIVANQYIHIVATYDGNPTNLTGSASAKCMQLYVNVKNVAVTSPTNSLFPSPVATSAGSGTSMRSLTRAETTPTFSDATVAGIRIFSKCLSPTHVARLYNQGLPFRLNTNDRQSFGCAFQYWFNADPAYASGAYQILDSVGGSDGLTPIHGTTINMVSGDRVGITDFTEVLKPYQMSAGKLTVHTYAQSGGVFNSPFTSPWAFAAQIIYDPARKKSFIVGCNKDGDALTRQSYIFEFDHRWDQAGPRYPLPYVTPYTLSDDHRHFSIIQAANGNIIGFTEDIHNSRIYVYSINPDNLGAVTLISTIVPPDLTLFRGYGYPTVYRRSADLYLFVRNSYKEIRMLKSSNNGVTWGTPIAVAIADPDVDPVDGLFTHWLYQTKFYSSDGNLHTIINRRKYINGNFNSPFPAFYYLRSDDGGTTWRNAGNTFSKNVVSLGSLTQAQLDANYLVRASPSVDTIPVVGEYGCLLPNGTPIIVGDYDATQQAVYIWNGTSWTTKVLTGVAQIDLRESGYLYPVSNTRVWLIKEKVVSGKRRFVKWVTDDLFDTITEIGDVSDDAALDFEYIIPTDLDVPVDVNGSILIGGNKRINATDCDIYLTKFTPS